MSVIASSVCRGNFMKRFRCCLAGLVIALAIAPTARALPTGTQVAASVSTLRSIGFDPDSQILTLNASAPLTPRVKASENKLLIDLPQAVFPDQRKELAGTGAIARIRVNQQSASPPLVRMELELNRPLEVGVRRRQLASGYEIRIEPVGEGTPPSSTGQVLKQSLPTTPAQPQPHTQTPPQTPRQKLMAPRPQLVDLRLSGENLVLEGSGPLAPEIRRIAAGEYQVLLYGIGSSLSGPQPKLQSPLIESVAVSQDAKATSLRIKLKSGDLKLVPASAGNFSTLQIVGPAARPEGARLTDLRVDDLDARTTRVRIYADQSFGYQVYPLEKPDRLVIDTRGTSMGTLPKRALASRTVRGVRFAPTKGEQDLRVVLDLGAGASHRAVWKQGYLELTIQRKAEPLKSSLSLTQPRSGSVIAPPSLDKPFQPSQQQPAQPMMPSVTPPALGPVRPMVVVDAGHGGHDPGAIGVLQIQEKDVTLAVSRYLAQYLANDRVGVALTRSHDLEVLLQPRVDVAQQNNAGLFVSVHCNSVAAPQASARGIETYYATPQSKELAETIHRHLIGELGATNRGVRKEGHYVTRHTTMPSVLIEIGFLTNPEEGQLLANPEYQRRIAKAIRDGIQDYLAQNRAP